MTAARRRDEILQALAGASGPVSAAALAARLGVSRQVVVGDVALLRAAGSPIVATPRGYVLGGGQEGGLRSGTEATAQIAGFSKAVDLAFYMISNGWINPLY